MRIFYDKEGRKGTTRIDFLLPLAYKYNCMNYPAQSILTHWFLGATGFLRLQFRIVSEVQMEKIGNWHTTWKLQRPIETNNKSNRYIEAVVGLYGEW